MSHGVKVTSLWSVSPTERGASIVPVNNTHLIGIVPVNKKHLKVPLNDKFIRSNSLFEQELEKQAIFLLVLFTT